MELFDKLKDTNFWDAQIVGKNLFCKYPASEEYFVAYFDFCIKVTGYPIEINTRSFFLSEAELALNVFSEKIDITEDVLLLIQEKRSELVRASSVINEVIAKNDKAIYDNQVKANTDALTELASLRDKLFTIKTQEDFENILGEIAIVDNSLNKSIFTNKQTSIYENLTRGYSELVSKKMSELAHYEDVKYNKDAAEAFRKAFRLFKSDENKYKMHDNNLYELVARYLFAYDARRLFSETLVYYNYVYSYIFNKLDDDGKYRFTQFSFDTPKSK